MINKYDWQACMKQLRPIGASIAILVLAGTASAFTVQTTTEYGNLRGNNLTYINIRESTATEAPNDALSLGDSLRTANMVTNVTDPTVLYGTPSVVGDSLFFLNPSFSSLAGTGGILSDVTDGRLNFSLQTDPTMFIDVLTLREHGAVSLTAPSGTANSGTLARVQAPAFLSVNEVMLDDGTTYALPISSLLETELQASPAESAPNAGWHAADPNVGSAWSGEVTFDIPAMLAANGVTAPNGRTIVGATNVDYDMNNTLTAITQDGISTAFIDKKRIEVLPRMVGEGVPEPASSLMLFTALAGLGIAVRRNRG